MTGRCPFNYFLKKKIIVLTLNFISFEKKTLIRKLKVESFLLLRKTNKFSRLSYNLKFWVQNVNERNLIVVLIGDR